MEGRTPMRGADGQTSINCPSCGVGLDILGGGRVRAHICSYCGATLDAHDDYKVIFEKTRLNRPETPLKIGMQGVVYDVPFTVIGMINWIERYRGKTWRWVDHQVYSPTHGYAWLTWEDGHLTFTRQTRHVPRPSNLSETRIETSENRPVVRQGRRRFAYYGSGRATCQFVEGEFNYLPRRDDEVRYVELLDGPDMLTIAGNENEIEYELTSLPPQDALFQSFGIDPSSLPRPRRQSPLAVFERSPLAAFARNSLLVGAAVALLCAFFMLWAGSTVARSQTQFLSDPITLPFTISRETGLTEIRIDADVDNSWAWFETELYDGDGNPVAGFEGGIEYYHGYEGGESWSEGNRRLKTRIDLPPGDYTLEISHTGADVWGRGRMPTQFSATVTEGRANTVWLWTTGIALFLAMSAFLMQRALFASRKWAGSDWSDD